MNGCKKLFWKQAVLKKDYQKTFKKSIWFILLYTVAFYGQDYENKRHLEQVTSLPSRCITHSKKTHLLVIYHQDNFDDLMPSGFWVNQKIKFANLS